MPDGQVYPSILIVDDEQPARAELVRIIKEIDPNYPLHQAETGKQAISILDQQHCEIVFLDIQLTEQNGIKLAQTMLNRQPAPIIIMATAHDEYALQGYELNVTDYILKPFRSQRIKQSIDKANAAVQAKSDNTSLEDIFRRYSGKQEIINKLWAERQNGSRLIINFVDIQWIQAKDKKVYIHIEQEALRVRATLSELAERLPQDAFVRVHKTYIVNINLVSEVIPWDSHAMTLVMNDKQSTEIPVGRGYADKLKQLIGW